MDNDANEQATKKGMGIFAKGCLIVIAIFVGITLLGAIVGGDEGQNGAGKVEKKVAASSIETSDSPPETAPAPEPEPEPEPEDSLTGPQRNAVRSAEAYLAMTGFSRKGLIQQLSSDAGDGYSVADATAAVDSLTVDWNEQAARSAKEYIDMMGFSCSGLVEQLSSDAGSGYTQSEAKFGATQAGAC